MPRPQSPIFWPSESYSSSIKTQMDRNYNDSINILQTQWFQADMDQRCYMGDQDIWGILFPGVSNISRKIFNFNIVNPIIQAVTGIQRQMRKSTISIPTNPVGQKTSDDLTKCLYYIHKDGLYQTYSDAFEQGALVQGAGYVGFYLDKSNDPVSGDIKGRYIDMKSVLVDPFYRKRDMSDARFFWTRQYFDKEELMFLYPKFSKEISQMNGNSRDDKFYFMPENYQIQSINVIALDEYWYLSTREALYLVDTETNEVQEFTGDEEDLRIVKMTLGDRIAVTKRPKQTVRRALMINGRCLVDEPNPYGIDRYPFVPFLGYFSPDTPYYAYKFRGMVRDMRDSQYLFNRRKVADLDIVESQQQGLKVKKGALLRPKDSLNTGHGRVLVVNDKNEMSDVEQMTIQPPSPILLQMEEMLMEITHRISGIDPSAMGIDVNDKAGIISMMRQAASSRNVARLFDQLDEAQTLAGDILIEMIQKNWTYSKVASVIGEEPSPEFESKVFFKYNAKVAQGLLTETQQQLELAQLFELQERFGDVFPMDEVVEAMTIQNKDRIVQKMMQAQQAQQQQQEQMAQLQMMQLQADNEMKQAYALSERGKAVERESSAELHQFEKLQKINESEAENARSILDIVKSLKELEEIDISQLRSKIEILHNINSLQFNDKLMETNENVNLAPQGGSYGME